MKKTSVLALLLVAVMVFVACGNTAPDTGDTAEGGGTATTDISAVADEADWTDRPHIRIEFAFHGGGEWGYREDPLTQLMEEMFNISIFTINGGDGSDFPAQMAGMLAAGNTPDIFDERHVDMRMLIEAGQAFNIAPHMTPALTPVTYVDPQFQVAKRMLQIANNWGDDEMFQFPMARGTWDSGQGILVGDYIRWDLYAELGYPTINTRTDLLNVLRLMQDTWPENHDGRPAYGISGWFADGGWGLWPLQFYDAFASRQGGLGDPFPYLIAYDKETMVLNPLNQIMDPDGIFWQPIWFYNQAHQMGILDPESFIQGWGTYIEKIEQGMVYHFMPGWLPGGIHDFFSEDGRPEQGFVNLSGIGSDVQSHISMMPTGERNFVISAQSGDPERLLAMLDFMSSHSFSRMAFNGVPDVFWEYVNGIPTALPGLLDLSITDEERRAASGSGVWTHVSGYAGGTIDPFTNTPIDLRFTAEAQEVLLTPVEQDALAFFGANSLFDMHRSRLRIYAPFSVFNAPPLPERFNMDFAHLSDFASRTIINIIRAESDSEFNQMRDEFMAEAETFNVGAMFDYLYQSISAQQVHADELLRMWHMPPSLP